MNGGEGSGEMVGRRSQEVLLLHGRIRIVDFYRNGIHLRHSVEERK